MNAFFASLEKIRHIPYSLFLILGLIASIGFMVLYSAAGGHFSPWAEKQMVRFCVGCGVCLVVAITDLRIWLQYSYALYAASLLMLFLVEFLGRIGMGAQRWIDLYVFTIQPSELIKITLLMALARYFHQAKIERIRQIKTLILPLMMVLVPAILVMRQPDLGTAILLLLAGGTLFFVAGIRLWIVVGVLVSGLTAIPLFWHFMYDYQKERILTFLNPDRDPLGKSYNIIQSYIALGSGGLWGKGFQSGSQSHLNFLPEKQTDFIFSTYCEEFGMAGGLFLLSLYIMLIVYGYWISLHSRSSYGRLLALGITTLLFLYVFINMGMVMGLVPVVGIPLPLVSYGGTALLTLMMGLGLLICVSLHSQVRMGSGGSFL